MRLNETMWDYRRVLMKVIKVDFPELPMARIDFTRLSRVEGDFVVDNAALKACPSTGNGEKLLQRVQIAAAGTRAVDFAQVTLSRAPALDIVCTVPYRNHEFGNAAGRSHDPREQRLAPRK